MIHSRDCVTFSHIVSKVVGCVGCTSARARIIAKASAVTQSHRQKLEFYPMMLGRVHLILPATGTNLSSRLDLPECDGSFVCYATAPPEYALSGVIEGAAVAML